MIYITGTKEFRLDNTAVALGKFDGLHQGHQVLLNKIKNYKSKGMKAVMFTFDYHPGNLFNKNEMSLIYTSEERRIIAKRLGIDVLIEYPFTTETAAMEPIDFVEKILVDKIDARYIVVGEDFHFGKQRKGDVNFLKKLSSPLGYTLDECAKITTIIPKGFLGNTEPITKEISSTLVRKAIADGNLELANEMLGRPYAIMGEVVHGREIGRTIGMPTANIIPAKNKMLPPNGVYSSNTILNGELYHSVTNIGINPTVAENVSKRVETYVYDFKGDIYGKQLEVQLFHYDREEMKFDSIAALKEQMYKDKLKAIEYFNR